MVFEQKNTQKRPKIPISPFCSDSTGHTKNRKILKKTSEKNNLVTFGIIPSSPETGYGYIEGEKPFNDNSLKVTKIKRFIEKPDLKTAKNLIKNKCLTWNSGIFLFKAKTRKHKKTGRQRPRPRPRQRQTDRDSPTDQTDRRTHRPTDRPTDRER